MQISRLMMLSVVPLGDGHNHTNISENVTATLLKIGMSNNP